MDCVFCLCMFAIIVTVDHIFWPQVEYIFQKAALQNLVGTLTWTKSHLVQHKLMKVCIPKLTYSLMHFIEYLMLLQTVQ